MIRHPALAIGPDFRNKLRWFGEWIGQCAGCSGCNPKGDWLDEQDIGTLLYQCKSTMKIMETCQKPCGAAKRRSPRVGPRHFAVPPRLTRPPTGPYRCAPSPGPEREGPPAVAMRPPPGVLTLGIIAPGVLPCRRPCREAYLPAIQARPEAPAWLPLPHGDRWRPQGAGQSPLQRPRQAQRLSQSGGFQPCRAAFPG